MADHGYIVDGQTATLPNETEPPRLFYYWTGSRNKPYIGLRAYGLSSDFKPAPGRVTLTSPIGRGAIENTECADNGTVEAENAPDCTLAFYIVIVSEKGNRAEYNVFAGKTDDGTILTDEQCRDLMALPVLGFTEDGRRAAAWLKSSTGQSQLHELDRLIDTKPFVSRASKEIEGERKEETDRLTEQARLRKTALNRDIERLRREIKQTDADKGTPIADRIDAEKRRAAMTKEVKKREQSVFLDGLKIDAELEEQIGKLTADLTAKVTRMFAVKIRNSESGIRNGGNDEK